MRATPRFLLACLPLALAACGSSVGGGGSGGGYGANLGAPAGTQCAANLFHEGCYVGPGGVVQRMTCIPGGVPNSPGTWTLTETCGAGMVCVQNPDPAAPTKKVTVCQVAGTTNPGQDATGGGDTSTGSGDTGTSGPDVGQVDSTTGGTDSGGGGDITIIEDTGSDTGGGGALACLTQKCGDAWASCKGNAQCESLALCMINCGESESCQQSCFNQASGSAKSLLIGVLSCGQEAGCLGGSTTTPTCGNGACESGETKASCPQDCGTSGPVCGNGACESGESKTNCPKDCGTSGPVCGNGACETGESKTSCPKDCGTSTGVCGDGTCGSGESADTCPQDCDPTTQCIYAACGTKIQACATECQSFYTCATKCGQNTSCVSTCASKLSSTAKTQVQTLEQCKTDSGCFDSGCGNGTCDSGETNASCPSDCPASSSCVQDNCPGEVSACENSTACIGIFECFQTCADGDTPCLQACYQKASSAGQSLYMSLAQCAKDSGC